MRDELKRLLLLAMALVLAAGPGAARAANCSSTGDGFWDDGSIWSGCGGNPPGASDNAVINSGDQVVLRQVGTTTAYAVNSLTLSAAGSSASLTHNPGISLAVGTGGVTINSSSNTDNSTKSWNIDNGSATVDGNVTLQQGSASNIRVARIRINDGTLTISGSLTFATNNAARALVDMSGGGGTLKLAGAFNVNNSGSEGTLSMGSGGAVFNFNGSGAQSVPIGITGIVYRNLYFNNSNSGGATLASNAVTSTNVTGSMRVQSGILNNAGFAIAGGALDTFEVVNGAQLNLTGTSSFPSGFATISLGATSTVNYGGTTQAVRSGIAYGHLLISGSTAAAKTPAAGTVTVAGNFTVQSTIWQGGTNNPNVTIAGNFTLTSATFTAGSGTYTFNGSDAGTPQTLTGAATFTNLAFSNTGAGAVLASNFTTASTGTLTLASGTVTTGANVLIVSRACNATTPVAVARTSGYVVGNLRKAIPAAAASCTFEVGSGGTYAPVVLAFNSAPGAGNITASTTGGAGADHGSIGTSAIEPTKSVNRYWTLTNNTVTLGAAGYNATFNFANSSPAEIDTGAATGNFIIERWDGANWFPTTLAGSCTATPGTNLCKQANSLTLFGDFIVGEPVAQFNTTPGAFNAFETTTAAGAILGRLFTKRVGVAFPVAIVAVANSALNTSPSNNQLTVDIIDASPTSGTLTASSNCRTSWTNVIQTQAVTPVWSSGRITVTINAPAKAVRNARIRVSQNAGANLGCSTDSFSIRPLTFTVTSIGTLKADQTGTTGTPAIKAGANFNLTASSVAGYDGTPGIDNSTGMVAGTPTQGAIAGSFDPAPVGTGTASGDAFTYSEVGNFGLATNAVFDKDFTGVDQPNDCIASSFSTSIVGGKYGCWIGSTAVAQNTGVSGFGRFTPDHFLLTPGALTNRPALACASTFTYEEEPFRVTFTLTARNGLATPAVTTNYAGSYAKLDTTSLAAFGFGAVDLADAVAPTGATALTSRLTGTSSGTWTSGVAAVTANLAVTRVAPDGPFESFRAGALPADTDGVTLRTADFNLDTSVPTDTADRVLLGSTSIRFGRLSLASRNGSPAQALVLPLEAQYWNGTSFAVNASDSCTSVAAGNVGLGNYAGNLNSGETTASTSGTFASGRGSITLTAPGIANAGSVDVVVNLGTTTAINSCLTWATTPTPAGASQAHLRSQWCGTGYTRDPAARATFGLNVGTEEIIFFRENF